MGCQESRSQPQTGTIRKRGTGKVGRPGCRAREEEEEAQPDALVGTSLVPSRVASTGCVNSGKDRNAVRAQRTKQRKRKGVLKNAREYCEPVPRVGQMDKNEQMDPG